MTKTAKTAQTLGSVIFWGFVAVTAIVMFPLASVIYLATSPFDPRLRRLHQYTCFWASLYTWLNPVWSVHVHGRQQIREGEAVVFVANHRSLVDIFVLHRLFVHFKWISKIENFRLPLVGWNMVLNRYVPVRRGDKPSVEQMFAAARRHLEQGSALMMFPEGTRSKTSELRPFKPGAFELALETGVPIVPIALEGTGVALQDGWKICPARIDVTVLEPVSPERFHGEEPEQVAERIREVLRAFLARKPGP